MEIGKADESLRAADYCYKEGLYNSSVSRSYYSTYQGSQVGLEAAGFVRAEWSHSGLQATFANELTRRRKLYSPFRARDFKYRTGSQAHCGLSGCQREQKASRPGSR